VLINTDDVYFKVPIDGITNEIKNKYSDEMDKFNKEFHEILNRFDFGIPVSEKNVELLTNPGFATLAGIKIKGHKFYKKEWQRIQGDYYYPKKNKIKPDRFKILKEALEIKIPSKMMFNLRLLNMDKVRPEFDNEVHLINVLYETKKFTYIRCSRAFFKIYCDNMPKDFELIDLIDAFEVVGKHEMAKVFNMLNPKTISPKFGHPMDKYPVNIKIFNGRYIIDLLAEPIDAFRITIDAFGKCHEIKIRAQNSELNTIKIRVADILKKIDTQIKDRNCIIEYIGGEVDNIKITDYNPTLFETKQPNQNLENSKKSIVTPEKRKGEQENANNAGIGIAIKGSVGEVVDNEFEVEGSPDDEKSTDNEIKLKDDS